MKYVAFTFLSLFLIANIASARTWVVDQNGLGDYTSIGGAVNVAKPGDVVKVHPGIYEEKVVIDKEIVVEGSGAECTMISNQNKDYAVEISAGKIKWFSITSAKHGVKAEGGVVTNCIFSSCSACGLVAYSSAKVLNCIAHLNDTGFYIPEAKTPIIENCIIYKNSRYGFRSHTYDAYYVKYCNSYGNPTNNYQKNDYNGGTALKSTGSLESDPQFQPNSYQISAGSPCKDAGNPAYQDPDGTRADMGYYGGPDAPTFPVLQNSLIKLNEDGTIQLNAVAISPY